MSADTITERDWACPCGFRSMTIGPVTAMTCPHCRREMTIDREEVHRIDHGPQGGGSESWKPA